MALREDILTPIPGDNPSGANLYYDKVYDQIKDLRKEEDDLAQGDWAHERKTADWPKVIKLCSDALATKSKDLQLAAWLTEALLKREGFAGLKEGLDLIRALIEQFWDTLYPEAEEGELDFRAKPLEYIGMYLDTPVRMTPLTKSPGYSYFRYKESRSVGYEADVSDDSEKLEARSRLIAEGKLAPEEFDIAFKKTPKQWYVELVDMLDSLLESIQSLTELCEAKFGEYTPGFTKLRTAVEEVRHTANILLQQKRKEEPDPEDVVEEAPVEEEAAGEAQGEEYEERPQVVKRAARRKAVTGIEPNDAEDAADRLAAVAAWCRQQDASNPAPYLMLRGYRWGELRGASATPDPSQFEAPSTEVRTEIKRLFLEGSHDQMIQVAETCMATAAGRAWLDLQRYVVQAADNLGYSGVAAAIRSELKALVTDFPDLVNAELMDGTPTANRDTQEWIRESVAPPPPEPEPAPAPSMDYMPAMEERYQQPAAEGEEGPPPPPDAFELARDAVRNGQVEQAVEILTRELAQERSGRGKFQRRMQLAQICMSAGHHSVALPILEEMAGEIDRRKLEEWEAADLVAHPLALLYRCLDKEKEEDRRKLYAWICRLDPVQALSCLK